MPIRILKAIVGPNCGTDLVGRKELATLLQTTAQDDCLRQFPDGMNILWDTPLLFIFDLCKNET